jgi:chromosome segregation ATPase
MKLHNQSDRPLEWEMGGQTFKVGPFGHVSVPERLVSFAKRRGLPLAASPVAAETRAQQKAMRAKQEAADSEVITLKNIAEDATAALRDAQVLLEREQVAHARTTKERDKAQAKVDEQELVVADLRQDLKVTDAKLREVQTRLAEYERSASREVPNEEESDLPDDHAELVKMATDLELEGVGKDNTAAELKTAIAAEIG